MYNCLRIETHLRCVFFASLLMFPILGFSESMNACEFKSTKDDRYLCTAVSMVNPSICDQISTADGVSNCKAVTSKNSYACDRITSPSKRQYCLMGVRDLQRDSIWAIKRMN